MKRSRSRIRGILGIVSASACILACGVGPTVAYASWGWSYFKKEHCSYGENHHCYTLAEWYMTGSEQVEGSLSYITTENVKVPDWEKGDFVDHEEWVSFKSEPGWWVEGGSTAGERMDCCSIHPFYAWMNASGYTQYVSPSTLPYHENNLYQFSGQNHNGTWCLYWGQTQERCVSGFPAYATILEVGAEYATESKPESNGHDGTNGWWNNEGHNWLKESLYADEGTCATRYPYPYPALGNINFYTC